MILRIDRFDWRAVRTNLMDRILYKGQLLTTMYHNVDYVISFLIR